MNSGKKLPTPSLSDVDMERLESLLWERAVPNGGMPLEMLDGYFCALACGPELVMPSEYNRAIWGDPPPVWESVSEGSESFYLIQGYWNHIVDRISRDPEEDPQAAAPAIMMPDALLADFDALLESGEVPASMDEETRAFPLASGWALGFFLGVELREDAWNAWADTHDHIDEHLSDIQRLMQVPGGSDADDEEDAELVADQELDADEDDEPLIPPGLIERLDIMFDIPHMLRAFDSLRRAEFIRAQGPAKREEAPGRNDPCPCGSGKKYKKCHGDPQRLH